MAQLGWITSLELKRESQNWWFGSRVERWDWHQHRCDRVEFYNMLSLDIGNQTCVEKMFFSLEKTCRLALQAWDEFPDSIPRQTTGNTHKDKPLEVEPIATRIIFDRYSKPNCQPTEFVTLEGMADEEDDVMLLAILAIAKQDIQYQDKFTHIGRNINSPNKDRVWGLDYNLVPSTWNGERLRYSPLKFSLESNLESLVGASLRGTLASVEYLKSKYPDPKVAIPAIRYRSALEARKTDEEILAYFDKALGTI